MKIIFSLLALTLASTAFAQAPQAVPPGKCIRQAAAVVIGLAKDSGFTFDAKKPELMSLRNHEAREGVERFTFALDDENAETVEKETYSVYLQEASCTIVGLGVEHITPMTPAITEETACFEKSSIVARIFFRNNRLSLGQPAAKANAIDLVDVDVDQAAVKLFSEKYLTEGTAGAFSFTGDEGETATIFVQPSDCKVLGLVLNGATQLF